jgi:tetratricopeptide (TPR) repeat protein
MTSTLPDFDSLWNYDDPASTEVKFRQLIPQAEKSSDTVYHAQLLTQIARTQGLQRKFDDAHKTLDKALSLIAVGNITGKIRYLLERGRVFNSSNQLEKARPLFLEAYEEALTHNEDNYAIDAAHMLGIVDKGEESLKWNERAMELAELTKDERAKKWLGSLYNNIGWTYHENKEFEKALDYFTKNVSWHESRGSKMQLIIAKWSVARTLRSMNRITEALEKQRNLVKELDQMKLEQDGYVFEEIGECLLLLNRKNESKEYFKKSYELLSKDIWLEANEKERLERIKNLSK